SVADFRDENDTAYIQDPCRDVPWNFSTSKNHRPIQQRQNFYILITSKFTHFRSYATVTIISINSQLRNITFFLA
ncbi:MAG: hypothetical protein ACK57R_20420, partial [Dolichospermum sp.]